MKFSRVRARTVLRVALAVLRLREQDLKPQTIGSAMKPVRRAGRNELTRFATEAQAPTGTPALRYNKICTIRTPLFWGGRLATWPS
jgi:hypothetical protein